MAKKPKHGIDLDVLHDKLSDDDLTYLLKLRTSKFKERMAWKLLLKLESDLDVGVDIVHQGDVTGTRRATPGETFRIRQALDAFNPADISTAFRNDNKTIAAGMTTDPDADLETLRQLATQDQDIDRPNAATPGSIKPKAPPRPAQHT
jgi:hypothetical protein